MQTYHIRGGQPLKGTIAVCGAKNSVSKIMVAALLTDELCILRNVPDIDDVHIVSELIRTLGGEVEFKDEVVTIHAKQLHTVEPEELHRVAGKSRIPILFAGPLLYRLQEALVPELGGCQIGKRPVDFHLKALETLGAEITCIPKGYAMKSQRLHGEKICLEYPSVGATEQVLLAAVLANGKTELSNAAVEPEIMDLIAVLQKMGAYISVDTDRVITIIGVSRLGGYTHTAITDRIEAASWACAAFATNGRIFVKNARQLDLMAFLNKYRQIGGCFDIRDEGIEFWRGENLHSTTLETDVHPGFMTDWQQPFSVLLTQTPGASIVHETVYEDRFGYTEALNRMGAQIQLYTDCLGGRFCRFGQKNHLHSAVIVGPTNLHGAEITVPNLRAGFSYVVAALAAEGETILKNMELIRRGYGDFENHLRELGASFDVEEEDV
ncbi:MAG: UDP-N-acetylglucosamine1-carboxyvinyltransferase [Candidatus Uhrbacteria bacterium GW2011_GWF2_41_16]|uniref:UDP-N-acetylglucosamine 1-carboxyvinyltransferase n=2 Tax=Candidatus Uhriibacteriota TaxID=1752732 RepID=A0A0G0VFR2_9BACT|nr:MAG: UDP-N-acetylglucosamine1-carboxyvinyltransferase [Candidatus Uhrbacteria bacterium GW2011_GWA2_41_10]KKR87506.1 MAG: UDP-N-acetylglucosamine1-carboxyvinyltransferase [Candidatus Uhrbacteria bacterium GW2011_GWC2_41_11]KKR98486.1 MAG: UDP-N-acetylglucosamine1-carboxyvinyltransferase [Candidatus Uhrbacteria bacterium GW2011_GWF2_41_16]HBO99978.1 UDP-N-acetylglucosamine 1-carboxyvinyltransferase [Candidatus Uhrbacteria bacterium]